MTEPAVALATGHDSLIEPTDNSGEPGQPILDQDPDLIPEGSVQ